MLILTRTFDRENDSANIVDIVLPNGETIEVRLVGARGRVVRLGFNAPSDCIIHRREIMERIEAEGGLK